MKTEQIRGVKDALWFVQIAPSTPNDDPPVVRGSLAKMLL